MVYPFDITSGAELQDNAITENGFKLDMAKSRYLTIDVSRTVLVNGTNGRTEDVRFNRPAKDGDQYKDEGIYKFNVHNLYTGENTTKTIYVGTDPFLRAMSVTRLSIKELEGKLDEGYTIGNDGKLIVPPVIEETEEDNFVDTEINEDKAQNTDDIIVSDNKSCDADKVNASAGADAVTDTETNSGETVSEESVGQVSVSKVFAIIAVIIVLSGVVILMLKKSGDKNKAQLNAKKNIETPIDEENGGDA